MMKTLTKMQRGVLTTLADNAGTNDLPGVSARTRCSLLDRGYIEWTGRTYLLTATGHIALLDGPAAAERS